MKDKFEYTYKAPTEDERREIEYIQNQYKQKQNTSSKLQLLRKLDNKVKSIPTMIALIMGIIGTLIFGLGLAMILQWQIYIWGSLVGVVGSVPILMSYFVYYKIFNKLKNKYSSQILKLSEELLSQENQD